MNLNKDKMSKAQEIQRTFDLPDTTASNVSVVQEVDATDIMAHPASSIPHARESMVIIEKSQSMSIPPEVVEVDEECLELSRRASMIDPETLVSTKQDVGMASSEADTRTLRRVPGSIPWMVFILCFVEFAERGSYYAAVQVFANFMNYPLPIGKSQESRLPKHTATNIN